MGLHKTTLNFTDAANDDLQDAVRLGGLNQTDSINRAVRVYTMFLKTVLNADGRPNGKKIAVHDDEPFTVTRNADGTMTIEVDYETFNILI